MHTKKRYYPSNSPAGVKVKTQHDKKALMWAKPVEGSNSTPSRLWKTALRERKTRVNYVYLVYTLPNICQIERINVKKTVLLLDLPGCLLAVLLP